VTDGEVLPLPESLGVGVEESEAENLDDAEGDKDAFTEADVVFDAVVVLDWEGEPVFVRETDGDAVLDGEAMGDVEARMLRDVLGEADGEVDGFGEADVVRENLKEAENVPLELCLFEIVDDTEFETDTALVLDTLGEGVVEAEELGEGVPEFDNVPRLDELGERDTRAERVDDIEGEIDEDIVLVRELVVDGDVVGVALFVIDGDDVDDTLRETWEALGVTVKRRGVDDAADDNEDDGEAVIEEESLADADALAVVEMLRDAILADEVTETFIVTVTLLLTVSDFECVVLTD
jgi:hypothetical protein